MKYMGSKSRIAKYIVPIIQSFIDKSGATEYYEPMVGGGNIIDKIKCFSRVGFDANKYLIALLSRVALDGSLADSVSKEEYDKVRDFYNGTSKQTYPDWYVGNVGFLASYNGRFFDGVMPSRDMKKQRMESAIETIIRNAREILRNRLKV